MSNFKIGPYKIRLPVIAAPMFLVSGEELVSACCKNQIVGTFPALNLRSTEAFRETLLTIEEKRSKESEPGPFGVNLIVHKSNPRLEADLRVCVENKVPLVITSLGAAKDVVAAVHSYGGLVYHDVTNARHAEKARDAGVDGLIAVSGGAGGHAGTTNPFALIAQLRSLFDKTLILAGGISSGSDIFAALAMGADLAYMGTRFIATTESQAQADYKKMILDVSAEDVIHTSAVSGVPANFMRPSLERAGITDANQKGHVDFGEKLTLDSEAKAWKNIWSAGHGVNAIHDILSVHELVNRLALEFKSAQERMAKN